MSVTSLSAEVISSGFSRSNFQTLNKEIKFFKFYIKDLSLDPETSKGFPLASVPTAREVTHPLWP